MPSKENLWWRSKLSKPKEIKLPKRRILKKVRKLRQSFRNLSPNWKRPKRTSWKFLKRFRIFRFLRFQSAKTIKKTLKFGNGGNQENFPPKADQPLAGILSRKIILNWEKL